MNYIQILFRELSCKIRTNESCVRLLTSKSSLVIPVCTAPILSSSYLNLLFIYFFAMAPEWVPISLAVKSNMLERKGRNNCYQFVDKKNTCFSEIVSRLYRNLFYGNFIYEIRGRSNGQS
jgi:hypothetical protein